ncbi:LysR family transcriptional regulator [Labilithrix luteola]|nr:LysR family transcriptional regulator [Labilithrix luteola]
MDRLGNIEAFVQTAETGSFNASAKRLGLTPSAVSRRVAQLERELGVALFHRTTRALSLSEDGRLFFGRCRSVLRELEDAAEAVQRSRARPAGRLRVDAPVVVGQLVLAPALPKLLARYPELDVELVLSNELTNLAAEGIDVVIRLGDLDDSSLLKRRLGIARMVCCAAPSYLERHGTPRTLKELERHDGVVFVRNGRPLPWRLRDEDGVRDVEVRARVRTDQGVLLRDLLVAGAGVGWLFDFIVDADLRAGRLVEVLADHAVAGRPIHALYLAHRNIPPKTRAFLDFAASLFERRDGSGNRR